MKSVYIITGAAGHLGGTLIRMLSKRDCQVRGLLLPDQRMENQKNITYYHGDVTQKETLRPLFEGVEPENTIVIHTAGIVDISGDISPRMYRVNVEGTRTVIALCREYGVKRLLHVSSVHAIAESGRYSVLNETDRFSAQSVVGGYAKTKAEATQLVLDAARQGLDAVVVHPSGIIGPFEGQGNHLVQLIHDYVAGKLPACVRGGYDLVDVRDVAAGCLAAAQRGRSGQCYILSNRHYEIKDVLAIVRQVCGGRRLPVLPMWMAHLAAPLLSWVAKARKQRPLYTRYSLYTLRSNDRFNHDKATMELQYQPRDLYQTIIDTVRWLKGDTVLC